MNFKKLQRRSFCILQIFCFEFFGRYTPNFAMEETKKKQNVISRSQAVYAANKKDKQMDCIIKTRIFPQKLTSSLFALFDEKNGNEVSKYLIENLTTIIIRQAKGGRTDYENILKESFAIADYKLEEEGITGWCTAILVLKIDNTLFVATVGNSKAILSSNGQAIDLSHHHLLTNRDERQRIKSVGSKIIQESNIDKLEGIYPVSRAIGDYFMKRKGLIATPEIKIIEIKETDNLLILAHNVISKYFLNNQSLIDRANSICLMNQNNPKRATIIAKELLKFASQNKTKEDLSLIVILFSQNECLKIQVKKADQIKKMIEKLANTIEQSINIINDSLNTDNYIYNICAKLLKKTLKKIEDSLNHLTFSIYDKQEVIKQLTNEFNNFLNVKKTINETYSDVDFKTQLLTNFENKEKFYEEIELILSQLENFLNSLELIFKITIEDVSKIMQ